MKTRVPLKCTAYQLRCDYGKVRHASFDGFRELAKVYWISKKP